MASLNPAWPHFNLIISAKTLFPNLSHSQGPGRPKFWGRTIQPSRESNFLSQDHRNIHLCVLFMYLFLHYSLIYLTLHCFSDIIRH